jgi:DNA-binding NarL/FixJ family response regulator
MHAHTLERRPDLEVVAEAANGREAVELCRRLRPRLVLMDLRMPEMDGIAATRAIKGEFTDAFVLVLTALEEPAGLSDALEAGAAGYVLKDAPAARISDAVRRVLAGERMLDGGLATRLLVGLIDGGGRRSGGTGGLPRPRRPPRAQEEGGSPSSSVASLTPRELEVLRLRLRAGKPTSRSPAASQSARAPSRGTRCTSSRSGGFRPGAGGRAGRRAGPARRAERRRLRRCGPPFAGRAPRWATGWTKWSTRCAPKGSRK